MLYTCVHIEPSVPGKCQMNGCCTTQMACACALTLVHSESISLSRNMQTICAACIQKYDACLQNFQTCYVSTVGLCCTESLEHVWDFWTVGSEARCSEILENCAQSSTFTQTKFLDTKERYSRRSKVYFSYSGSYFVPVFLKRLTSFIHL